MKLFIFILLFISYSCAHWGQEKNLSSGNGQTEIFYPDNHEKIFPVAKFFSNESKDEIYLFLETKNAKDEFVDVDESQLHLRKSGTTKNLERTIQRADAGRYYIRWKASSAKQQLSLDITYGGKKLAPSIVYEKMDKINFKKSSLTIEKKDHTTFNLELKLVNNRGKPLDSSITPEILFEGAGHLSELKSAGPGIWHFNVILPQENQILYFGVQLNGQREDRFLRFQYVEKQLTP
jgi:hypothetical protein